MKRTFNYLLFLMLGMLTLNLQSCGDDDDDNLTSESSSSIQGTWRMVSTEALNSKLTFNLSDSSQMVYEIIDVHYIYYASHETGKWVVARCNYTFNEGNVYDGEGNIMSITTDGSNLSTEINGGLIKTSFKKEEIPAEVKEMILSGQYTDYSNLNFTSVSSESAVGSWRQISGEALGSSLTIDMNDSTQMVYEKFDGQYIYAASYKSGSWVIARCKCTLSDGKLSDAAGNYMSVSVSGSNLTLALLGGIANVTFQKEDLPTEVSTMIANGDFTEYKDVTDLINQN